MLTIQYPPQLLSVARRRGIKLPAMFTVDPTDAIDYISQQMNGDRSFGMVTAPDAFTVRVLNDSKSIKDAVAQASRILANPNAGETIKATTAMAALGDENAQRGLGTLRITAQLENRKSPFGWNPVEALFNPIKKETERKLNAAAAAKGMPPVTFPVLGFDDINWKKTADGLAKGLKVAGVVLTFVVPPAGIALTGAMAAADAVLSDPNVKKVQDVVDNTKALASLGDESARKGAEVLRYVDGVRRELQATPGQLAIEYEGEVNLSEFTAELSLPQLDALRVAAGMESEAGKAERLAYEAARAAELARLEEHKRAAEASRAEREASLAAVAPNALRVDKATADRFFARIDGSTQQMRAASPIEKNAYMMQLLKEATAARKAAESKAKLTADAARRQREAANAARRAAASVPVVKPLGWFTRLLGWLGF